MRRAPLLAAGLLTGCFHPSYENPACAADRSCPSGLVCGADDVCRDPDKLDGGIAAKDDAPSDAPTDALSCFGRGLLNICLDAVPTAPRTLNAIALDTSSAASCTQVVPQASGPELCVIAATQINVGGSVVATGSRPLVLVATDALQIAVSASLDVSSRTNGAVRKGAGANDTGCANLAKGGGDEGGAGGGAGGSFGTAGGDGGKGDSNDSGAPAGPARGGIASAATSLVTVLRGGCPGGAGGAGSIDPGASGGAGGAGGGAVYLIAATSITVGGAIFASGAGGNVHVSSAGEEEGGGGGGAGGMVGLDAPSIIISGTIAANGGGGGGGGALDRGGAAGDDGSTTSWNVPAVGGAGRVGPGATHGGEGARGTAIGQSAGIDGESADGGGGGGGGGLGLVWLYGTVTGGTMVSPAPVKH